MKHFKKVLDKVDWVMLAEQRQELAVLAETLLSDLREERAVPDAVATYIDDLQDQYEAVEGVLNLLDCLSDAAEEEGLYVYPETQEE